MKTRSIFLTALILMTLSCGTGPADTGPEITLTAVTAEDWGELLYNGQYRVQNNVWNRQAAVGRSEQRIFLWESESGDGFGWEWNWGSRDGAVVAYPEVICGIKPWEAEQLPNTAWRVKATDPGITADFAVKVRASGTYNMAFSLWAYKDPLRPKDSISHEIMIWNDTRGLEPAGTRRKTAKIGGRNFDVFIREGHGDASGGSALVWSYAAFRPVSPFHEGTLVVDDFLAVLIDLGFMTGDEYISSLEWGNEVVSGRGRAEIDRFVVNISSLDP